MKAEKSGHHKGKWPPWPWWQNDVNHQTLTVYQTKIHSVVKQSIIFILLLSVFSTKVQCQDLNLEFTQESYDVVIPENSIGKVYAVPSDLNTKMGIYLGPKEAHLNVRFRIKSGDDEGFFKAEAEQIGNFVFLLIRTRTNNNHVLNRERRDSYELEIRTRIRDKDHRRLKMASNQEAASTIVRVTVKDVNDLDPFFQPSNYAFTVPEDTPLHQVCKKLLFFMI